MAVIAKLSDEEIKKIQDLWAEGYNTTQIAEMTNHSKSSVSKYVQQTQSNPPKKQVEETPPEKPEEPPILPPEEPPQEPLVTPADQPKRAKTIETRHLQPASPLPPYLELPAPAEWLENFLKSYRIKDGFIQVQINRVARRNELPHPSDLMADMQQMDSGQNNLRQISYIMEEYDYGLRDFLKKYELQQKPVSPHYGIPLPENRHERYERYGHPVEPKGYNPYDDRRTGGIPIYRDRDPYYDPPEHRGVAIRDNQPSFPSELERYARIQNLMKEAQERNPMLEQLQQANAATARELAELPEDRPRARHDNLNRMVSSVQQYQGREQ